MQGVLNTNFLVCIDADVFGVVGQVAQGGVFPALSGGVAAGHVGREQDAAEQRVDRGKLFFLLRGQLAVFLPQEKHIRVAAVGAAVQLTAENRVADALLCGHALAVEQPHIPHVVPIKAHIAADAAIIHHPERRHNGHTAAQNQLVTAPIAQQLHSPLHPGSTRFVRVAKRRCTV